MTPDIWTAVATGVMAAFTVILALCSSYQAWLTRLAIQLGRDEFNASHRPRLRVRSLGNVPPESDTVMQTVIWIANVGDSAARIISIRADVGRLEGDGEEWLPNQAPDLREGPLPDNRVIAAGERREIIVRGSSPVDGLFLGAQELDGDFPALRFIGEVAYDDARGIERHTGFHFYWNRRTERWSRANPDNDSFQYED